MLNNIDDEKDDKIDNHQETNDNSDDDEDNIDNLQARVLIYWHTRAAIDDSCGLGFGQSERSILMMINLEALVAGASWTFISDLDLVTSDTDARMIQSMFNR